VTHAGIAAAVRRAAGLFALPERAIVEVEGNDRVRWLDGMLSNDVAGLAPGPQRSGCRALALTRKGQIVADVYVWLRPRSFWLETDAAAVPGLLEHLRRLVVSDDVRLADRRGVLALVALEGPAAPELAAAAGASPVALAACSVAELAIGGVPAVAAAYGASGEPALRLAVDAAALVQLCAALAKAGRRFGLVDGSAEALEILRIEAGTPAFASELAGGVLPAEARLEAAVAFDKGCYTGQEIVARVESRGQVKRRLTGLLLESGVPPSPGAAIDAAGERVGEVTSACVSPARGAIALGFVRLPHAEPGAVLRVGGEPAHAAALPLVAPGAP
jgi:folate-binding protein YgfZ